LSCEVGANSLAPGVSPIDDANLCPASPGPLDVERILADGPPGPFPKGYEKAKSFATASRRGGVSRPRGRRWGAMRSSRSAQAVIASKAKQSRLRVRGGGLVWIASLSLAMTVGTGSI